MSKPFFEEEYRWFEIELYNSEDIAVNGDHAKIQKFSSDDMPDLHLVASKAKELGYDAFAIKEIVEIQRDYNVEDFS